MIVADDKYADRGLGAVGWFFCLVRRHKLLVALPIAIGFAGACLIFILTPKSYTATAVVALDVRKLTFMPTDMSTRLPPDNPAPRTEPALRTEIDVLTSRSTAGRVIHRLGTEALAPLLPSAGRPISGSERERQILVNNLIKGLRVSNDGRSFTIYISFTTMDPVFAAELANGYAQEYLTHQNLASPEAQLISEAQPPNRASSPRLYPLLVLGILVGAVTAVSAAFLWDQLDDRVGSAALLEARCELPILGGLPSTYTPAPTRQRGRRFSCRWRPIHLAEPDYDIWLQRLQAVVRFSPATRNSQVIVVTSSVRGEGKTFVSIALARAFAAAGSSAVVIDADLQRPTVGKRLHLEASFSWDEMIAGEKSINEIVQTDPRSAIDVITADASGVAPKTLFPKPAFDALIANLRQHYDRIIIDTPPVAASADTAVLGTIADATILVVQWRATTYTAVIEALHQMTLYSLPVAGIVVNRLDSDAVARYATRQARVASRTLTVLGTSSRRSQAQRSMAMGGGRYGAKAPAIDPADHT